MINFEVALTDKYLQSKAVEQAVHPVVRDASAEKAMRRTQALPADAMHHLTPTLQKFVLKNKVAIVTGWDPCSDQTCE